MSPDLPSMAALSPLPPPSALSPSPLLRVPATVPAAHDDFLNLGQYPHPSRSLAINSRYLSLDGRPWMPVMGEFHYSRCPEGEWATELAKLRAGGVDIVASYVFWNHHEPHPGRWRWDGQRALRRFVQLAGEAGLLVYLRPGPWCHGEVRLGGFPDWLPATGPLRCNDPSYLAPVQALYAQVAEQVHGLLWRDGGPIVGLQLENEYGETGPGRGAEHIAELKRIAVEVGLTVPLYTVTGWPTLDIPAREVLPVSGAYADGFWQGARGPLPPSGVFLFNTRRVIGEMGNVDGTPAAGLIDTDRYPFCLAEAGGGMHQSYHRRPVVTADDVYATTLVQLGSGANLYGYYMYHGGINPVCETGPLNETQASGYPNDVPQWGYDFHAPLGSYGQLRPSWARLRLLHGFMQAFGDSLAPLPAVLPDEGPFDPADSRLPRLALRGVADADADADAEDAAASGFVFVNHHRRHHPLPALPALQWRLGLEGGAEQAMPAGGPFALAPGRAFIWPLGQRLGAACLAQATLQPITRWSDNAAGGDGGQTWVLMALDGLPQELLFDEAGLRSLSLDGRALPAGLDDAVLPDGSRWQRRGRQRWLKLAPSDVPRRLQLLDEAGCSHTLLLLPEALATAAQRIDVAGRPRLLLSSHPAVPQQGDSVHLHRPAHEAGWLQLWPADDLAGQAPLPWPQLPDSRAWLVAAQPQGPWALPARRLQAPGEPPAIGWGPHLSWRDGPVPCVPGEPAWARAARWQLDLDAALDALQTLPAGARVWLTLDLVGDVLRFEVDGRVVDDRFFDGTAWTLAIDRWRAADGAWPRFTVAALPIDAELPVFLEVEAREQARAAAAHGGAWLRSARLHIEAVDRLELS